MTPDPAADHPAVRVRVARPVELDAKTLHDILRLRSDIFIVEQQCPYDDIDGRDFEPRTRHLWVERDGAVVATLRLLAGPPERIGRVCTAATERRQGLASLLITTAFSLCRRPVVLDAQSHLAAWYRRFGFEVTGDEFVDVGIPHLPMTLSGGPLP